MSDTITSPPLDTSVSWLAAYALGLAYSESSDPQRLTDLIEAARGQQELLEAAHRRLDSTDVADRWIHDDALHLLVRAIGRVVGCDLPAPGATGCR